MDLRRATPASRAPAIPCTFSPMGKSYGAHAAKNLSDALHERMVGVWYAMDAKGDLPRTADEFASVVVHSVFDVLAAGVAIVNEQTGAHPDDPAAQTS